MDVIKYFKFIFTFLMILFFSQIEAIAQTINSAGYPLELVSDCQIRSEPLLNLDTQYVGVQMNDETLSISEYNPYWVKYNLPTDQNFWVQKKCVNQSDKKAINCPLYSAPSRQNKTFYVLLSHKYQVISDQQDWLQIRLNHSTGYMGSQCFGHPLLLSDRFYRNLVKICERSDENKLAICPVLNRATQKEVTNPITPMASHLPPRSLSGAAALRKSFMNFNQKGVALLKFKKFSDYGLGAELKLKLSNQTYFQFELQRDQYQVSDLSATFNPTFFQINYFQQKNRKPNQDWELGFGFFSNELPLLAFGTCSASCQSYSSSGLQSQISYLMKEFNQFHISELESGLKVTIPIYFGQLVKANSAIDFKLYVQPQFQIHDQMMLQTEVSYSQFYRDLQLSSAGGDITQSINETSLGVKLKYLF